VRGFAATHGARVEFFQYLQWQAELQIAAVEERCFDAGLAIGLYTDLAVSVDSGGADAWANQDLYVQAATVGAPPDEFNMNGQNWGLPPPLPAHVAASGHAEFIAMVRANMVHAGALRIDHVMGLARLYWVPAGMDASAGAYVNYAFAEALGILALESHRHRCVVIGEDLGTVPDELRAGLAQAGVLSYRLLIFEHDADGNFNPPAAYPRQALAALTTHDLPTIAGYWRGRDLQLREEFGQFPDAAKRDAQVDARERERAGLVHALERERLLPLGVVPGAELPAGSLTALGQALHAYVARTPTMLMIAQLEDAMEVGEQANLPSTIDEHPNWRRKLPVTLEQWETDVRFPALVAKLEAQRPAPATRPRARRRAAAVRIPRATYRLQLHREFTFRDATAIVPYLAELGISHVYCSPYLRARSGSTHGYDIVDHSTLNPEIGSAEDFDRFTAALAEHDMGQVIDVVPNHMGVMGADNAWWLDVLENGQASVYADFFDIDWQTANATAAGRVLVPVLGDHYGAVLAAGELTLKFDAEQGSFSVFYHEHRLPIDPREYPRILAQVALQPAHGAGAELQRLAVAFGGLPARDECSSEAIAARAAAKDAHQRELARLVREHEQIAAAIAGAVRALNGEPGQPASFDRLHELLEAQAYRLAFWRIASDEINYRRFFDINDLAALRMENEAAFEATHRKIFEWLRAGKVDALRIDHVDGLFDPAAYCRRLQDRFRHLRGPAAFELPADNQRWPLYVITEKIIASFEDMPQSWGVYGTTGYRFANVLNGLFVDTAAEQRVTRTYHSFIGDDAAFDEIAARGKHLILRNALASELMVLANRLARIAHANRDTRDYTVNTLRQALAEVIARFPVYRTYIADKIADTDRRYIEWAIGVAKRHSRAADVSIFDFIKSVLLADPHAADAPPAAAAMRTFAQKFQQVTAPGDGERRGGHRVLHLQPAGVAQRRRRRARDVRRHRERISWRERRPRQQLARHDAGDFDPRQQAQRGRARAHRRAVRAARAVAIAAAAVGAREPQQKARSRRRAGALAQRRIPAVPDADRDLAGGS
jgi:(1->4)-alpha-D-glucan 1-alpha-D-glucosylmutase